MAMLIFLYGPDTYRSRQKLNEIIGHYQKIHQSGLNFRQLDCSDSDFADFKNETETFSMFKEKKLVVLKNAFSNPQFEKSLLEDKKDLSKENKDIIIFYEDGEVDERKLLFKFLKENSKSQEFKLLAGQELKSWLKKEFEKDGFEIEVRALETLILFCGNDLWQMVNEVQKLKSYAQGQKISAKDVDLLVRPKIDSDIFETISSLAERKKDKALLQLHQHLEKGDAPLYLLSMINFQFRNLLVLKDLIEKKTPYFEIAKRSGLHPFVVKKTYWQAERFNFLQLKKIYQKIFQIDLAVKTGKIEPETALDLLIAEL